MRLLFFLLLIINTQAQMPSGRWHASLVINDTITLPFNFTAGDSGIVITNGDERIHIRELTMVGDSVFIQMPIFDSELRCKLSEKKLTGNFYNHARKTNNIIPFHAEFGITYRFTKSPTKPIQNITGQYHVFFPNEDDESKDAIGIFHQTGNKLIGTFLTTTGDYRYLEGEVNGNRIWLSAFDGSHLFMFTAIISHDSLINGEFFSGKHWHDTWSGVKDEKFKMRSEDSLTTMLSAQPFNFSFPDENGKTISLSDDRYKDKPVIVQIMGSWCPNCMDETKFLSKWYNEERPGEIEIIALDYEKIVDHQTASNNIIRLKKQFNINYAILFAGSADKNEAAKTLPMLNRVFAFPTTIFLDKNKKIVKIQTGFNGPATGVHYQEFINWFTEITLWMIN